MKPIPRSVRPIPAIVAFAGTLAFATAAGASSNLTYVSAAGTDNADCTAAAPCRSLNAALSATNADGQIVIVDTGSFEPATITQSVSIIAPADVYAVVSTLLGTGITINAPFARVVLKGLAVTNTGLATAGIGVIAAGQVSIENVTVFGFDRRGSRGLSVNATTVPIPASVNVLRSTFRNNSTGVYFQGWKEGLVSAVVRDVVIMGGSIGVDVRQDANVVVQDSTITGTDSVGVNVEPTIIGRAARLSLLRTNVAHIDGVGLYIGDDAGNSFLTLTQSRIEYSLIAFRAGSQSNARMSGTSITENVVGIDYASDAFVESIGNNIVRGNLNNGDDPVIFLPK